MRERGRRRCEGEIEAFHTPVTSSSTPIFSLSSSRLFDPAKRSLHSFATVKTLVLASRRELPPQAAIREGFDPRALMGEALARPKNSGTFLTARGAALATFLNDWSVPVPRRAPAPDSSGVPPSGRRRDERRSPAPTSR